MLQGIMPRKMLPALLLALVLFPAVALAQPNAAASSTAEDALALARGGPETRLVTVDQVVAMTKAGVSDAAIVALINRDRPIFVINHVQLVQLRKDGVSESLIQTMVMTPYYWYAAFPYYVVVPVAPAPPPPSSRGIFFTRPTKGIFFK